MDPYSHRLANTLVGNHRDSATLEVTIVGPEVEFEDARIAAVTGAEFEVAVDGRPAPLNSSFAVSAGSVLRFGHRARGARAYLGVAGGIASPRVLDSRATHLPSQMGGIDGRPLRAGDVVPLGKRGRVFLSSSQRMRPVPFLPDAQATVRILPGPQADRFAPDALDVLQSAPYVLDAASNRMGFRLHGPHLRHAGEAEMLSDATPLGVLQVPSAGEPILLMADRPATGGYPSLATVISADIRLAGQLAPGNAIVFVVASMREALAALIAQEQTLMALEPGSRR
jgi:antagonist of KipI